MIYSLSKHTRDYNTIVEFKTFLKMKNAELLSYLLGCTGAIALLQCITMYVVWTIKNRLNDGL